MSYELIIFVNPKDSNGFLMMDNGYNVIGSHVTVENRDDALLFNIPQESPNGNGCRVRIERNDYVPMEVRAILWLNVDGTATLVVDDFHLQLKDIPPPFPPIPPIPPKPPINTDPEEIINKIYSTGNYNLSTKSGCGQFTEACATGLHLGNSNQWGHIRKFGAQNQYNGHAVDAIMLLIRVNETQPGIYDIILDNESPNAKPQFIFRGEPVPELWYYPA